MIFPAHSLLRLLAAALIVPAATTSANAATVTCSSLAGTTSNWLQDWNNATVSDGTYLLPALTAGDTAIINQNRTVKVDAPVTVTAGTVIVNNTIGSALPNAKLEILPGGSLNTGAITVSLNTDPGELIILGGSLTANGNVTVKDNGTFLLSGGSLTRGGTGTRDVFSSGGGAIHITGGSLTATATANTQVMGLFADTIHISGGNIDLTGGQVIAGASTTLIIDGDQPDITLDRLNLNTSSRAATIRFVFDDNGVSPVTSGSYLNLANAKLEIDGTAYTGGAATFDLFLTPQLIAASGNVTITGLGNEGVDYTLTQDTTNGIVRLELAGFHGSLPAIEALGGLTTPPAMFTDDSLPGIPATLTSGETKKVFYDTLDYLGNPTRACAWIGIPAGASPANPVPAVVLAHGGGGKPYLDWVQKWNQRGYAAIAMGLEGQTDIAASQAEKDAGLAVGNWLKHQLPGPVRVGIYGDSAQPITDQWMYHAAADVILANSLMRSLPEVDSTKVGIMGVSWGGVITSTVIGIDDRFAFAIPVYGAGNKHTIDNQYGRALSNNSLYQQAWDPDLRIHLATMPALWFSWPGENNFSLDSQAHTYAAAGGPRMVSLVPGMNHSHPAAWNRPESYDFADSIVASGAPWCVQSSVGLTGQTVQVVFNSSKPITAASLIHTADVGYTGNREWTETSLVPPVEGPAGKWTVNATLPTDTTAWFVNAITPGSDIDANDNGTTDIYGYVDGHLVVSSDYQETRGLTVSPSGLFSIQHPSNSIRSATTLYLGFLNSSGVTLTSIEITAESHPGALSCQQPLPWVLNLPLPSRKGLVVEFDNSMAQLAVSQSASATLTLSWQDQSDGSTGQIQVPVNAEIVDSGALTGYDFANIFPLAESWSASGPRAVVSDVYDAADASSWSVSFPETDVFAFSLKGTSSLGDWTLRVGKGGQVFSIRANGDEWMAPQWRNSPTPDRAPWVDEVIQPVAINTILDTDETPYFIHGAGTYLDDPAFAEAPFYSPMLASRIDAAESRLNSANWAQHAHVPTAFQSGLVNFQRVTDRGEGIVEIENVIHNGGPEALDRFNLPWMGARYSSLPKHYIYTGGDRSDVSADLFNPGEGMANLAATASTDGFAAFTESSAADAPCLMVVFGNAPPSGPPGFANGAPDWRYGVAGTGAPDPLPADETSWRNLRVGTARYQLSLLPGESFHARYFLVIGRETEAKTLIAAHDLVARCGITKLSYSPASPGVTKPWYASREGPPLLPTEIPGGGQEPWFHVSPVPIPGWRPLLVENGDASGPPPAAVVLTDNYYQLSHPSGPPVDGNWKPYNGNTAKWSLLGFLPTSPTGIEELGLQSELISDRLAPSNTISGAFIQPLHAGLTGPDAVTFGISGLSLSHRIPAGWSYHIEESENLSSWSPLTAPAVGTNTLMEEFLDEPDENTPRKFFRMSFEPPAQP